MNPIFVSKLIKWYGEHGRELPWRHTEDPYRIWISEIILQQTQVAQGYDYYLRFVERFPDVKTLAGASIDEVLKYWQGLGYYSRARNLHAAAQQIVEMGQFPSEYSEVRSLKGVGDYTAAAIMSFAYKKPYAVVDGNVYRVLSRFLSIETPMDTGEGKRIFAALAEEFLDKKDPARYNQAIMDFGALQCTPKSPRCECCPMMDACSAFAEGRVEDYPVKSHTTKVRDRFFTFFYIRCKGEIALCRREENDIWKGLYEVPVKETDHSLSPDEVGKLGFAKGELRLLRQGVKHQLSHQLLHADFYLLDCVKKPAVDAIWVDENCRDDYAVSKLMSVLFSAVDASS